MTVSETVSKYKSESNNHKFTSIFFCPSAVQRPRIGKEYTITQGAQSKVPEIIGEAAVTNHYVEDGVLCIYYESTPEMISVIEHPVSYQ